jgi:hypothetical protein
MYNSPCSRTFNSSFALRILSFLKYVGPNWESNLSNTWTRDGGISNIPIRLSSWQNGPVSFERWTLNLDRVQQEPLTAFVDLCTKKCLTYSWLYSTCNNTFWMTRIRIYCQQGGHWRIAKVSINNTRGSVLRTSIVLQVSFQISGESYASVVVQVRSTSAPRTRSKRISDPVSSLPNSRGKEMCPPLSTKPACFRLRPYGVTDQELVLTSLGSE